MFCYVDITTKDVGDFVVPKIRTVDGVDVCSFIPNEEFGFHFKKPVVIMLDELGKAKGGVMNACLRLMQERQLGTYELHPDSIVFATTNLAVEGIGDNVPPHARNRVTQVRVAKPTAEEWMTYAISRGVNHTVIATVREYPEMLASYEDYESPQQNTYINGAASCMLVSKAVQRIKRESIGAWMQFVSRMSKEAQGLFARSVMTDRCPTRDVAATNPAFAQWAAANNYMFARK
jgi:hypothetical protein